MKLRKLREPTDIRDFIQQVRKGLDEGENLEYDFQSIWSLNKLPKYLWDGWKNDLKSKGITWQTFLRILRLHTLDAIEWALRGTLSWDEFLERVIEDIERYGVKDNER